MKPYLIDPEILIGFFKSTPGSTAGEAIKKVTKEFNRAQEALREEMLALVKQKAPTPTEWEEDTRQAIEGPKNWVCGKPGCVNTVIKSLAKPKCYTCGETMQKTITVSLAGNKPAPGTWTADLKELRDVVKVTSWANMITYPKNMAKMSGVLGSISHFESIAKAQGARDVVVSSPLPGDVLVSFNADSDYQIFKVWDELRQVAVAGVRVICKVLNIHNITRTIVTEVANWCKGVGTKADFANKINDRYLELKPTGVFDHPPKVRFGSNANEVDVTWFLSDNTFVASRVYL